MGSPTLVHEVSFHEVNLFPKYSDIENGQLFILSLTNKTDEYTHALHRFPAKFIPQIPRWCLDQFTKPGSLVVDPFMGSGTTLVEGLSHDCTVIGLDIDPLSKLITKAKSNPPSSKQLSNLMEQIKMLWKGPSKVLKPPMPDLDNFEHWYSHNTWAKLQALLEIIISLNCENNERDFLLVLFSSILRWVSKADDQSQKTYVSGTLHKNPPDPLDTFWRSFDRAITGVRNLELNKHPHSKVSLGDGNAIDLGLQNNTVDLFVTSPPYLDSVDYMYNFMLEYFWLGPLLGVPDRVTFNKLRRIYIGAKNPEQMVDTPKELLGLIDTQKITGSRQKALNYYFSLMAIHFQKSSDVLHLGGKYVLVIGNSQTGNNIVPVHDCLVRLAATSSLEIKKYFGYRVRRHYMKFPRKGRGGIILIDWVIVFEKVPYKVNISHRLPLTWVTLGDTDVAN